MSLSIYVRAFVNTGAGRARLTEELHTALHDKRGRVKYIHAWHEHEGVSIAFEAECSTTTPYALVCAAKNALNGYGSGDASAYVLDNVPDGDVAEVSWNRSRR